MQLDLTHTAIYLATDSPDFRKQIDGLVTLIVEHFPSKVNEGIFIFINRSKDKAKIIFWHKNGFVMIYKRLERGKFTVVADESGVVTLTEKQFIWLFEGYDWLLMSDAYQPNFEVLYA